MNGRRLLLIRHGQVDPASRAFSDTPRGRQWDPPLSRLGREQARLLNEELRTHGTPGAIYTSPLRRCRETIEPFAAASGREPVVEDDLGEFFVGDWEGKPFEDILDSDEEVARRFHAREPLWTLAPGGEPGDAFRKRIVEGVERILSTQDSGDLVLMVHGGVINAYVMHVLGIVDRDMFFLPENTSLNIVAIDGPERRIQFINDVRHLMRPIPDGAAPYARPPERSVG